MPASTVATALLSLAACRFQADAPSTAHIVSVVEDVVEEKSRMIVDQHSTPHCAAGGLSSCCARSGIAVIRGSSNHSRVRESVVIGRSNPSSLNPLLDVELCWTCLMTSELSPASLACSSAPPIGVALMGDEEVKMEAGDAVVVVNGRSAAVAAVQMGAGSLPVVGRAAIQVCRLHGGCGAESLPLWSLPTQQADGHGGNADCARRLQ